MTGIKVNSYNIKEISLILGTKSIEAFMQDSTISLEQANDKNTKTVGLNGNLTYNKNNDNTYLLTFNVESNSEDHEYLRGLFASDTVFAGYYENGNTGEKMVLNGCKFQKNSTKADGKEMGGREWMVLIADGQDLS